MGREGYSGKGRGAGVHDEEDHGGREQVDLLALVALLGVEFGRHVPLGAQDGLELAVGVLVEQRGEPEVGHLQVEVLVEKHVLGLQVAVRVPLRVQVKQGCQSVIESLTFHQLLEVEPARLLLEPPRLRHVLEQLPVARQLQHHAHPLLLLSILLLEHIHLPLPIPSTASIQRTPSSSPD